MCWSKQTVSRRTSALHGLVSSHCLKTASQKAASHKQSCRQASLWAHLLRRMHVQSAAGACLAGTQEPPENQQGCSTHTLSALAVTCLRSLDKVVVHEPADCAM